jgi:hypothetical protein
MPKVIKNWLATKYPTGLTKEQEIRFHWESSPNAKEEYKSLEAMQIA